MCCKYHYFSNVGQEVSLPSEFPVALAVLLLVVGPDAFLSLPLSHNGLIIGGTHLGVVVHWG